MSQKYKSMKDVAAATKENGHLMPVTLGDLREALGYNRLGVRVLGEIAQKLSSDGLGYFPSSVLDDNEVPRFDHEVRVFTKRSPLGELVQAVLDPTNKGDERLRESAASDASTAVSALSDIRKILATAP